MEKGLWHRQVFLGIWTACFVIIILLYVNRVTPDGTTTWKDLSPLLSKTCAVILPQLVLMLAFFLTKPKRDIKYIINNTPFAMTAYFLSILYVVGFTILIYRGIYLNLIPGDLISVNEMILEIMGYLSIFASGPIAYLFSR